MAGGYRKYGNKKKWCERYRSVGTRIINKIKKLKRHMKRLPKDKQAAKALKKLTSQEKQHDRDRLEGSS